MFRNEKEGMKQ